MANPLSFGAVVALALAGSGTGIYLGKSAISEINPAYFSTPLPGTRFHSDLAANPPSFENPPVLQNAARYVPVECKGCSPGLYEQHYSIDAFDYEFAPIEPDYVELETPLPEASGEDVVTVVRGTEDVVRYAYYQVSSEAETEAADTPEPKPEAARPEANCLADSQCEGHATSGT